MKVSYNKKWSDCGTCYTQTITINKKEFNKINKYFNTIKVDDLGSYEQIYFKTLKNTPQETTQKSTLYFLNLTQIRVLNNIYKNNKRILIRNTILKLKEA
jgi:hypothetical protein